MTDVITVATAGVRWDRDRHTTSDFRRLNVGRTDPLRRRRRIGSSSCSGNQNHDASGSDAVGLAAPFSLLLLLVVAGVTVEGTASVSPSFVAAAAPAFAVGPSWWRSRRRLLSLSSSTNGYAKDLLYQVQEQMLVDQGVHEDNIMTQHVFPLLETTSSGASTGTTSSSTTKSKGSSRGAGGAGGGFGPNAASKRQQQQQLRRKHKAPPPVDLALYVGAIQTHGVVRINSVLPLDVATNMRNWVVDYRVESLQLVQEGKVRVQDRFADVLLKHNRCDMTLPLASDDDDAAIVMDSLYHVLCQSSVLPGVLRTAFGGDDPILYELSTLISDPGSQRQVVHPDNPIANRSDDDVPQDSSSSASASPAASGSGSSPVLLTCFVALQDVTPDMGPTVYLPGTHTPEAHNKFFSGDATIKDQLLQSNPKWLGLLRQGDCSLYDSRVLHCGSANRHPSTSRALFYMSFRNPTIDDPGNPPSIRRDVGAKRLTLSQLQQLLIDHWTSPTTRTS